MKIPHIILKLTEALTKNDIEYRIGGGQAAVLYGLRDEAKDWDFAIEKMIPKIKEILGQLKFVEIPDTEGLSWEGEELIDFIIADGQEYPTIKELGVHETDYGLKFVSWQMMGYINWKDGKSAYQKLKSYREDIENNDLPEAVDDIFSLDKFERMSNIDKKLETRGAKMYIPERLIVLANKLEDVHHPIEAMLIDRMTREAEFPPYEYSHAIEVQAPTQAPVFTPMSDYPQKRLKNSAMEKLTGMDPATIDYYLKIGSALDELASHLENAERLPEGSPKQIELKRSIYNKYNTVYDPYNVDHPGIKIKFVKQLRAVDSIISRLMQNIFSPEKSQDQMIEELTEKAKEDPQISDFLKLKRALG